METIDKVALLRDLELGSIVAEQDELLSRCFIKHSVLSELVYDRKDVILGSKGAGKSALWKELKDNQKDYERISDVHLHLITNPSGDPEFRDILSAINKEEFPDPEELRVAWRLYFLAQFWRASKPLLDNQWSQLGLTDEMKRYGIISNEEDDFKFMFAYALAKARALKNIEINWTKGIALEFDEAKLRAGGSASAIPFNRLINDINNALEAVGKRIWLILDRLDEIVLGDEERENLVLKGLLLAFRDVCDFRNARVKIFLRDDVYSRVTSIGHFPALTHVRSKAAGPIKWELEDLLHLVVRRLLINPGVLELLKRQNETTQSTQERREIYYQLFPSKVDKGRSSEGFKWITDRIADANGVATPRDLLSVVEAARQFQIEQIERESLHLPGNQFFTEETLRKSVRKVSEDNLSTRIFAEYPDLRNPILSFSGSKADHNDDTLQNILGEQWEDLLLRLQRVGFLSKRTRKGIPVWTIPFFYSYALDITRGFAFDPNDDGDDDDSRLE